MAIEILERALTCANDTKNRIMSEMIIQNIGVVYTHMGQFSKAMEIYQRILEMEEHRIAPVKNIVYNNIATLYLKKGSH